MASGTAQDQLRIPVTCYVCDAHDRLWDYRDDILCDECLFTAEEEDAEEG